MPLLVIESDSDVAEVGDTWRTLVYVTNADGQSATPDSIAGTATKPDLSTGAMTVTQKASAGVGFYDVTFPLATAGRYTAVVTITSAAFGGDVAQLSIEALAAGVAFPVIADVRAYLDFGGQAISTRWSDAELQTVLDVETAAQRAACGEPSSYPKDLRSALLRRCQVHLAKRPLSLGLTQSGDGDQPVRLADRDTEVRRLEAPWRRFPVG